jgi:hypothetical protein
MATPSLSELAPEQRQTAVVLARLAAQREVKRIRQKMGIKGPIAFATLSRLANEWLDQHRALLLEAAASPIVQQLGIPCRRRRPDPKRELVCRGQVRNGGEQ